MSTRQRNRRMMGLGSLLVVLFFLTATGCDDDITGVDAVGPDDETQEFRGGFAPGVVKVMTRNVYVGADVDAVLAAQSPNDIPVLAAEAFQMLLSTNFPERAEAFAAEIEATRPHLVGLQEISTIRVQSPGDAIAGGTAPAEEVLFDFLDILLTALQNRGLNYRVAGTIQNADVEVPMVANLEPLQFDDVRLTDYDVVLARGDVGISRVAEVNYQARLPVPGFGIEIPRGYVAVDATVGRKTYRFVNTHLEPAPIPEILPVQLGQAQELVASLQGETLPVIVVGDLNTPAPTGETYQYLESQGFVDVWTRNLLKRQGPGNTNPHDPDLRNEFPDLYQRIDLIFVRNPLGPAENTVVGPVFAVVVGDELDDLTPSGLWPSDHAGVVARMRIPVPLLAGR